MKGPKLIDIFWFRKVYWRAISIILLTTLNQSMTSTTLTVSEKNRLMASITSIQIYSYSEDIHAVRRFLQAGETCYSGFYRNLNISFFSKFSSSNIICICRLWNLTWFKSNSSRHFADSWRELRLIWTWSHSMIFDLLSLFRACFCFDSFVHIAFHCSKYRLQNFALAPSYSTCLFSSNRDIKPFLY